MAAPVYYTAEMARVFPEDGNKNEVVHGELLVTRAPRPLHEVVWSWLFVALNDYLRREPIGHLFGSRSDISWGPDTLVSPDISLLVLWFVMFWQVR